jgi:PAS domain S-box-containing protein
MNGKGSFDLWLQSVPMRLGGWLEVCRQKGQSPSAVQTRWVLLRSHDGQMFREIGGFEQLACENAALRRQIAALEAEKQSLWTIFQSIGDALITADTAGNVLDMNSVAQDLTGWTEVDARGRTTAEVFRIVDEQSRAIVESPVAQLLQNGIFAGSADRTLLIAKNGAEQPIAYSGALLRDENGEVTGVVLIFRDQTQQRAVQQTPCQSERLFRLVFENSPLGKSITGVSGSLRVNKAFCDILGYGEDELRSVKWQDITHPDDIRESSDIMGSLIAGTTASARYDKRYIHKTGRVVWTEVNTALQRDEARQPSFFITTITDVTERKQVAEALLQANERLKEAQQVAHVGSWEWDAVQDRITGSTEFHRLFDVPPAEIEHFPQFVARLHPDDRERVERDVADALQQERSYDTDYRVKLGNQGWRDINARGQVVLDTSGKPLRMVGTCLDITERKRIDIALRASETRLRTTLSSIGDGVISTDAEGRVVMLNPVAEALTGWSNTEANGRTIAEVFHIVNEQTRAEVESPATHVMRDGVIVGLANHTVLISKDGIERPIADSGAPIRGEQGELTGMVLVFRDQTEERRAETERNRIAEQRQLALDAARLGWWHYDPVTQVAFYDARYTEIFGVSGSECPNEEILKLLHPDDIPNVWAAVQAALDPSDPKPYLSEYRVNRPDGTQCWVEAHGIATFEGAGDARHATSLVGTVADVTERKQAQQEIESLARFPSENPNAVMRLLFDGKIIYANKGSCDLLVAWNCTVGDCVPQSLLAPVARSIAQRGEVTELVSANDRVFEVMFVWVPGVAYVNVYGRDITKGKNAEEALRRMQALLNESQRITGAGGWEYDIAQRRLTWTDEVYRIHGLTKDYDPSSHSRDLKFYAPKDQELLNGAFQRAVEEGVPYDLELTLIDSTGAHRRVRTVGEAERIEGKVARVHGNIVDITARKLAEDALRASESRLRRFYESGMIGVIYWNMGGKITEANDKFLEMVGYTREDLANGSLDWGNMTPPEYRQQDENSTLELAANGVNQKPFEKEYIRKDGTRIPILLAGAMLDADRFEGVAFVLDISARCRAEEEIRQLNSDLERRVSERTTELEASNRELEAFSYSVSHDLRAPLRAIDGFTRILYDDFGQHLDAEGKRLCDVIRENTGRMGRLIDDLLSFSRLGRTAMLPSHIDMATMVNSVFYELSTPECRERIDLHIGSVPAAFGDPSLMRQVWANLLSNAIKFTSKVQRAALEVTGEQTDRECIFTVKDNGAGFDMQYVDKLFGVFQRLHSTKEFEGTGVGLALVQRIIRRHGGRVWAEGEIDRGAKFCFALPKKEA